MRSIDTCQTTIMPAQPSRRDPDRPSRAAGRAARLLAAACALIAAQAASAATVLIWPIYPTIESDEPATALWVENKGDIRAVLQLRVFAWQQFDGEDQYQSQSAIIGSPPMMEVAPGEKQMIRLIRSSPTPAGKERAFRVIIDEIPAAPTGAQPAQDAGSGARAAVQLQMRYSLPLFVYGEGLAPHERQEQPVDPFPGLTWKLVGQDEPPILQVRNDGPRHVRLTRVAFIDGERHHRVAEGLLGYVLPGSERRWVLPDGLPTTGELRARIHGSDRLIQPASR